MRLKVFQSLRETNSVGFHSRPARTRERPRKQTFCRSLFPLTNSADLCIRRKETFMHTETEVKNSQPAIHFLANNKDEMLKELQDLRDMLEELYEKNLKLDEENLSLRKEVRNMKGQIGYVLETMRGLSEDLKKAHEILKQPRSRSRAEMIA